MGGFDGIGHTPKKFKLPRKAFVDSSSVHPASVPRKLRSAIKKRSCESVAGSLPDLKRLSRLVNSVEPLRNDCSKKSKLSMNGCSDNSAVSVLISKDEEEVAETLFAMAGMIPLNDIQTNDKMDGEPSEGKATDLVEKPNDQTPAPKGSIKPEVETGATCRAASCLETNATITTVEKESVQEKSSIEAARLSWPNLSERRHIKANLRVSVPQLNVQTIPPLLRTCDQRSWVDSTFFNNSTAPSLASGLKEIKQEKVLLPYKGSHNKSGVADARASDRQHVTSTERSDEGLSLKALHGSGLDGQPLQSSTVVFPSWVNTATSSSELVTSGDTISADKVLRSKTGGSKSWKKCTAHVHISHLIKELQTSEVKDTQTLDASQLRPSQCLSDRLVPQHSNTAGAAINGMTTGSRICDSTAYTSACEASNAMPVNHKLGEQEEGPSKMQSFDFLSLSAGMSPAAGNGINRTGNNLEPGAKSHILYLHSVAQHSTLPFSMPQNRLPTDSYEDKFSAISGPVPASSQVHLQVPPYFGNHFGHTHMGSTVTAAQQWQRNLQHQQQHQIWTAQLAARFRPGPLLSSHNANWQNRRHDLRSSTHHMQGLLQAPQPSLEVLGSKYAHISQQQPQLVGLGPLLPPTKAKPHHNQLSSICEDNGGRFNPNGVLPLQLLCSEERL